MLRIVSVNESGVTLPDFAETLKVGDLIDELAATIVGREGDAARRLASDIVAALVGEARSWPSIATNARLDPAIVAAARRAARRLAAGAPLAYAVGRAQFRHLDLEVDERVLIPRPETEVLVDEIISRFRRMEPPGTDWGIAVDIGTGSGAIALSLAAEGEFSRVIGTDTSLDAIDVARKNAGRTASLLKCPVEFRVGSMLGPLDGLKASLLAANPPYIAFDEAASLPRSVRDWEPPTALFAGSEGLHFTAAIVQKGASLLRSGGILAVETDERRASLVAEMAMSHGGYIDIGIVLDLTGRERFVFATRA